MVGDHLQAGVLVKDPGKDQPGHGGAGLVGPAEGPPDLVVGLVFGEVVRVVGAAGRVQPDGQVRLGHQVVQGQDIRVVNGTAVDVGEDLHPPGAKLLDGPVGLGQGGVHVVHGQGGDEAAEPVRVLLAVFRHAVIAGTGQIRRDIRSGQHLQRRLGQGDDLLVVPELVHLA